MASVLLYDTLGDCVKSYYRLSLTLLTYVAGV